MYYNTEVTANMPLRLSILITGDTPHGLGDKPSHDIDLAQPGRHLSVQPCPLPVIDRQAVFLPRAIGWRHRRDALISAHRSVDQPSNNLCLVAHCAAYLCV